MIQNIQNHGTYIKRDKPTTPPAAEEAPPAAVVVDTTAPAPGGQKDGLSKVLSFAGGVVQGGLYAVTGAAAGGAEGVNHATGIKHKALWGTVFGVGTFVLGTALFGPVGGLITTGVAGLLWGLQNDESKGQVNEHVQKTAEKVNCQPVDGEGNGKKALKGLGGFVVGTLDGAWQNAKHGWSAGNENGATVAGWFGSKKAQ